MKYDYIHVAASAEELIFFTTCIISPTLITFPKQALGFNDSSQIRFCPKKTCTYSDSYYCGMRK